MDVRNSITHMIAIFDRSISRDFFAKGGEGGGHEVFYWCFELKRKKGGACIPTAVF